MRFLLYAWRAAGPVEKAALVASVFSPFGAVLLLGAWRLGDVSTQVGAALLVGVVCLAMTLALYYLRAVWWRMRLGPPITRGDDERYQG